MSVLDEFLTSNVFSLEISNLKRSELVETLGSLNERGETIGIAVDRTLVISTGTGIVGLIPESDVLTRRNI